MISESTANLIQSDIHLDYVDESEIRGRKGQTVHYLKYESKSPEAFEVDSLEPEFEL